MIVGLGKSEDSELLDRTFEEKKIFRVGPQGYLGAPVGGPQGGPKVAPRPYTEKNFVSKSWVQTTQNGLICLDPLS